MRMERPKTGVYEGSPILHTDVHGIKRNSSSILEQSKRHSITTVLSKPPNKSNSNIGTIVASLQVQEHALD